MSKDFDGKVTVVTGAASGIGRATALAFAREGATLVLLDRDATGLDALRAEVQEAGSPAVTTTVTDVTSSAQVDAAHDAAVAEYGRIDVGVNNAGVTIDTSLTHEMPEASFDNTIGVNLKGVWLTMRAQLRHMYPVKSGAIVNMASIAGKVGAPGAAPYAASKHGIVALTRSAAVEYAKDGIRVNAVAPGTVETPMFEEFRRRSEDPSIPEAVANGHAMGRMARPPEVAEAVLWLASDKASFACGSVLFVDGGFTIQ